MRIVVMSDSHGHADRIEQVLECQPHADWYLFLGDGQREFERVMGDHPTVHTMAVAGNCDWSSELPLLREPVFAGVHVLMTHGHIYNVKYGLLNLSCAARERGVTLILFGHTHRACEEFDGELMLVNPGSLGDNGAYAVLDITEAGIRNRLCRLED